MGKRFSKATLVLLFLSVLTLAAIIMPIAKAQSMSVTLTPSEGPVGTQVIVEITNFPSTDYTFSVTFGTSNVGTIYAGPAYNTASTIFYVPTVSLGKYTVTVTGSEGEVATTTFTVTQAPSPTPTETPTGTSAGIPTGFSPTNVPVTVSSGFWSPLAIAITSVVIAFAIFMTAVYVMRGKQKPLPYREDSAYEHRPSTPSKNPNAPSNINQPYQPSKINQPYQPSKINQPATNIQKPPFTRVCRHCKRTVRDDLNICPYCSKRLK